MPVRHINGVVDIVLSAVQSRIVPGMVKRNGPRWTDNQKTTGAFFCQLSQLMKGVYLRRHLQRGKVITIQFKASFRPHGWVLVTITDVTDMLWTKTALRKQTDRYKALSNAAFEAMFISITSQVGKGTTFNLHFPATSKPIVDLKDEPIPKASGKETILLVDDEEMVRNVSCQMLRKRGYTVVAVQSGEAAIAMVAQKEPVFDLVILDMIMPGMNGGGAYDRLRQIDSGLKVLLSSGYHLDGQASGILSRGATGLFKSHSA